MRGTYLRRAALPMALGAALIFVLLPSAGSALDVTPPAWVGQVSTNSTAFSAKVAATSDPSSTQEEPPGLGHKFELFYSMHDDQDPLNTTNDVISVLTTPTTIGVAHRDLPPGSRSAL